MGSLSEFRKEIIISTAIVAGIVEIGSFLVIGLSAWFLLGLAAGTLATMLNFGILVRSGILLADRKSAFPVVGGYAIRLLIYGIVFLICIKLSLVCGAGCGIGFITLHVAIFVLYMIVYRFIKKDKNPLNDWTEPKKWNDLSIYDEEDDWK